MASDDTKPQDQPIIRIGNSELWHCNRRMLVYSTRIIEGLRVRFYRCSVCRCTDKSATRIPMSSSEVAMKESRRH